jgi:hypothetical protein
MAAKNKPAGIRVLVYGIGKGKGGIEGFERVELLVHDSNASETKVRLNKWRKSYILVRGTILGVLES